MKTVLKIALVMIRGGGNSGFGSDARKRGKLIGRIGNYVLFLVLAVYFLAIASVSAWGFYGLLDPVGLAPMMIGIFLSAGVVIVFFFGILYVMSVFYFSSDVEKLLHLPIRAEHIIAAKFLVSLIYEYLFLGIIIAPALTVYGIRSQAPIVYYPLMIAVFLLLPIIPLAIASVLVMAIMRFTTFARNKDRFNMVSMMLALGLSMAFVFGMQSMTSMNPLDLAALLTASADRLAAITASAFPGTAFAAAALGGAGTGSGLLNLLLLLASSAVASAIVLLVGRAFYFKGVIGISAVSSARRKLTSAELDRAGKSSSAFISYMAKDIRILFRTPIYFANCVLMNFLWPVFILLPFLSGEEALSIGTLRQFLHPMLFEGDRPALSLSLAIAFAGAALLSSINGIAASALSREGRLLYIMKMIPMSYNRQIMAKVSVGVIFSAIGCLMILPFLIYFLLPPLWYLVLLAAILPAALLLPNLSGILFDLLWPKLHWDNEAIAVKRNLNVVFGMLAAALLAGLVVVPVIAFDLGFFATLLLVIPLPIALTAGLILILFRSAPGLIRSILA